MSYYNSPSSERSNNAYIVLSSEDDVVKQKNILDPKYNSNYLTAKSNNRARSCSPSLSLDKINTQDTVKITTTAIGTASVCVCGNHCLNSCNVNITSGGIINNESAQLLKNKYPQINTAKASIQTGMDRYVTVVKRQRSPKSAKIASSSKLIKDDAAPNSQNRFSILEEVSTDTILKGKPSRPPPIYLREQNSNDLVKSLVELTGENSFYVIPIKRGKINETKIQVLDENNFRKVVSVLESKKKSFYTYQLKSSKGLQVVLKGIDSCVDPLELKSELENKGFKIKAVVNIRNREHIPQPLFRVELEPGDFQLKKNEVHPIYNLKYVLHRKISVEQPHKRSGPVQCLNCQEFGHTRAYCKLPAVCVVCGELHNSGECDKPKNDEKAKKCSNCGKNHTANYRGCPVYSTISKDMKAKKIVLPVTKSTYSQSYVNVEKNKIQNPQNFISYANVVRSQNHQSENFPCNIPTQNPSKLEATLDTLVQTINSFTSAMNNMMQEMMKMQSMILQALLSKK